MAIYHCSMKPVARSGGRSAVAAIAYRTASRLLNERDGQMHDFTRKQGVEHAEIVLPEGLDAVWALDRSTLWNAMEAAERRKDARVAREFEIALPHELTAEQRLELTRAFARDLADRYGAAVDFAIHRPHTQGDIRNIHAHVLMTTRMIGSDVPSEKTLIERENKWLLNHDHPTSHMQLRDIRQTWENHANRHLVRAGLDVRIDHRSHLERGLEIEPTEHMGVHAAQMDRRGMQVSRGRLEEDAARRNAALIREKPEQVLAIITGEKSVFDRHDVARTLHRYINDDAQAFQNAFAAAMASPALVELQPEQAGELARYSTREMIEIEHAMAASAARLGGARNHGVNVRYVADSLSRQDGTIKADVAETTVDKVARGQLSSDDRDAMIGQAGLSDEQRVAVRHITGPEQISVVIGFAGAGKSTMLAAARDAWERQGYRVHGAALAGKAAEGLEASSGITSRTLASWEYGWQSGKGELAKGDILVIDEAGMVGSRQLAKFVIEAEARGAKLVLVGDHEQLQAIGAGSPFRAIAERIGAVELSEVRRQRQDWQRQASVAFATHRTDEGLAAYADRGAVHLVDDRDAARAGLVQDYLADLEQRPAGSRIALAHRRVDVRAINADIRASLQESGKLARGEQQQGALGCEIVYQTNDGKRSVAPGDRIVLLENHRELGVRNGMLGTVQALASDEIQLRLDDIRLNGSRNVTIPVKSYQAFDHGYATTIHKSQGSTVERAFVMASATMDRHLTYVAMTRHREDVQLYAAGNEFVDHMAGKLVEHGVAPYEHRAGNRLSYFVTLEDTRGDRHTTWGVDLQRALTECSSPGSAPPAIGATVALQHLGSQPVQLPDGRTAQRNSWNVMGSRELACTQLQGVLSRSGAKETSLDFTQDFALRRGLTEMPNVRSNIGLAASASLRQNGALPAVQPMPDPVRNIGGEPQPGRQVGEPEPLVPAMTHYSRSIDDIAWEKARPHFDEAMEVVGSVGRLIYVDVDAAVARLGAAIVDRGVKEQALAHSLAKRPEQFGELLGNAGLLGENRQRKLARHSASALSSHVAFAAKTWERRLEAERQSEAWHREKRDVVEVPGLTQRCEAILRQLDALPQSEKRKLLEQLWGAAEGRQALEEAKNIANAIDLRFGSSDPRHLKKETLRFAPDLADKLDRIIEVARIADRARLADQSLQYELKRLLIKGLGLGM